MSSVSNSDSQTQNTPDLVPDVILHIVENFGFLRDFQTLLSLRLISKTWNIALQDIIQKKIVCIVSNENISAFLRFLYSETSLESQESNIRSVVFNILERPVTVPRGQPIRSKEEICTNTMAEFTRLPRFFLEQLLSFRLNFKFIFPPPFEQVWKFLQETQLSSLEEFQLVVSMDFRVPVFPLVPGNIQTMGNIRFERMRRLEVPLHVSLQFLECCSDHTLTHLTLNVFSTNTELRSDFWETFKTELIRQKESMTELYLVNKAGRNVFQPGKLIYPSLFHANLRLKKLGLGITFDYNINMREEDELWVQFFNQQSTTIEYLHLPAGLSYRHMFYLSNTFFLKLLDFPNLVELKFEDFRVKSGQLFFKCPRLETICLPTFSFSSRQEDTYKSLTVRSVSILESHVVSFTALFQVFPNMKKLKLEGQIKYVSTLKDLLRKGTELKELSIKVEFNILNERAWMRDYEDSLFDENDEERLWNYERPIKADCFILGQKPQDCKPYQSGQIVCNATTEFPVPSAPSLTNFHCLEYLSLEGYFTELTLWAGIKTLTKLKEFHLKSQSWLRPKTFLVLESHLPKLKSWSYTTNGIRDMYKFFRSLPNVLGTNQIHVWKFNDWNKEDKKVVNVEEFEDLPDDFYSEPDYESDLKTDTELSNSDQEYKRSSGEETGSEPEDGSNQEHI